jgi:hypothetical protein
MKDWNTKKECYLQDDLPKRLGNLAVNLARIESLSNNSVNGDLVKSLVEESKFFIEWVATDIDLDKAADLIEFQIQLAKWQLSWAEVWVNPKERMNIAKQAHTWSEDLLDISGLISGAVS